MQHLLFGTGLSRFNHLGRSRRDRSIYRLGDRVRRIRHNSAPKHGEMGPWSNTYSSSKKGFSEKNSFLMALPVDSSVSPTAGVPAEVQDKVFQAESADISVSGARVKVHDLSLLQVPMGETIRLTISLPQSWGTIRCLGALRNVSQGKGNGDVACLGVEFVEIPIADKRALERFLTEGEAPAVEKILVAEDEEPLRNLLGKFLRSKGYEVALAATGVEVLELAGRESPSLILLDVRMPELDGIAACMRLKKDEKTRAIPVIILTAFEDTLVDALEAGADDFLRKPCEFSEIAARIRAMLRVRHLTNDAERAAAYMKKRQRVINLH
jgi:two-component system alkaline phosphatase synthesis response regulator PhoP